MSFFDDVRQATNSDTPLRSTINVGRQAIGDTSYRERPQALDPADAAAYAAAPKGVATPPPPSSVDRAQAVSSDADQKYFRPSSGSLPVPGVNLAGGAPPRGTQVYNIYDQDRPASMGAAGNDPWKDMARQLATFSALRARGPDGPQVGMIGNPANDSNALLDKWGKEYQQQQSMRGLDNLPPAQRAAVMSAMIHAGSADRSADLQHQAALAGQGVTARGQDLGFQGHMGGINLQNQGAQALESQRGATSRDVAGISAGAHLGGIDLSGQNQLANTALHQALAGQYGLDLKKLELDSPEHAARAKYFLSGAGLHDVQRNAAQQALDEGKSDESMVQKWMQYHTKANENSPTPLTPDQLLAASIKSHLGVKRLAAAQKNPEVAGYADGGAVDPVEALLARTKANYGVANGPAPQTQAPAPAPQQQPPAPPPPPQNRGLSLGNVVGAIQNRGKQLRDVAGYADGGAVDPNSMEGLAAKLRGMDTAGQNYTAKLNSGGVQMGNTPVDNGYDFGSYMNNRFSNFAEGGPIDVSGRQVLGEGTGKSDSLPAVIDGKHPAALSTEEFVMPVEAVRHFGLAKLNKMVEQARKGG